MSDNKKYYYYKIANKINNKIYIGRTTKELEERMKSHLSSYRNDPAAFFLPLYSAFRKYGIKNFKYSFIKEVICFDIYEANKIEKELMQEYNTFYPHGYNVHGLSGNELRNYRRDVKMYIEKGVNYA